MLRRGALLAPIVALILIAGAASAAVDVGQKAPGFTLDRLAANGTISLSDQLGQPTVVVFWLSTCPHCQRELPILQKLYSQYHPKGLNVVGVSADQDKSDGAQFVKNYKLTFPNAYAGTSKGMDVLDAYGVTTVPTIFVIDKQGKVSSEYDSEVSEATLRKALAKVGIS